MPPLPPAHVPVIDVTAPDAPGLFAAAAAGVGCFYATGTGVTQAACDALLAGARAFFDQPLEVKNKYLAHPTLTQFRGYTPLSDEALGGTDAAAAGGDAKEGLYYGVDAPVGVALPLHGPNVAIDEAHAPGLQAAVDTAFAELTAASVAMLPVAGDALGVGPAFFADAFAVGPPMAFLRPLHYVPASEDDACVGAGAHTDYGFITLLLTDGTPGLEIDVGDGEWRAVPPPSPPPPPGEAAVFVNVGDMLHRWSNGRWRSVPHRVAAPAGGRHRYSAAFFFDPPFECAVECVTRDGEEAVAPPVRYGDYLLAKYRETHASFKEGEEGREGEEGGGA